MISSAATNNVFDDVDYIFQAQKIYQGANILTWVMPIVTGLVCELRPLADITWSLDESYELNHESIRSLIQQDLILL